MLGRVQVIALNTYRESLRARILLGLAGVAFATALYATIVASFTLDSAARTVSDLGAASTSIFALLVTVVIAATSLQRELEQKTIYPILARPVARAEYLLGKYAGTWLTLLVFVLADTGLVLMACAIHGGRSGALVAGVGAGAIAALAVPAVRSVRVRTWGPIPWSILVCALGAWLSGVVPDERRVVLGSAYLCVLEVSVVTALAMLMSSFSTPFLSAVLTLGMLIVFRNADTLAQLPVKQFGQGLHDAGVRFSEVVPNLQVYVPPRGVFTGEAADVDLGHHLALATLSAFAWTAVFLAGSSVVLERRDFA